MTRTILVLMVMLTSSCEPKANQDVLPRSSLDDLPEDAFSVDRMAEAHMDSVTLEHVSLLTLEPISKT